MINNDSVCVYGCICLLLVYMCAIFFVCLCVSIVCVCES